jgi:hypothetical protein
MRPAPVPAVTPNGIVATLVAQRPQFLENADQGQPFARCALDIVGQQPVDLNLPTAELGTWLNFPLIRERRLPRSKNLAKSLSGNIARPGIAS